MTIINNAAVSGALNGMSISTSNVLTGITPTIVSPGVGEIPLNIRAALKALISRLVMD